MFLQALSAVILIQLSAVATAWSLRWRDRLMRRYLPPLVSFAVGVLIATAILHLLPETIATLGNRKAVWMLFGATLMALFCGERVVYAFTGETVEPEIGAVSSSHRHDRQAARPGSIVAASMLHSLIDGTAVATAFAANPHVGGLTALAIALHEIPHRAGDFALFVHLGVSPRKSLWLASLAGVPSLLGVGAVWLVGAHSAEGLAWLLPVSAASFLYIALVNLLPEIERERQPGRLAGQMISLFGGIALVAAADRFFPS